MTDPVESWFSARGWQPFGFQREAWAAWAAGESGLIHAPTGMGKTLAAWLGPVRAGLRAEPPVVGPRVLWVTPLRALAADTVAHLRRPLVDLGLDWSLESRTGDTGAAARARQRRRLPSALVTTPESLALLLSYGETARQLASLHTVVVDEWHELLGSKRGTLLELALARLRALAPALRTWGLSATLANLDEALASLVGAAGAGRLIQGIEPRDVEIESIRPVHSARFPWAGHLGTHLADAVIERLDQPGSTLLFTNTRAQAELWFETILRRRPDWLETLALHHGSLARDLRERVEAGLRSGSLRCVVATSSLDLGVDFAPVDRVIQVGSPKGAARLLQRAGRSGHAPGRASHITCVPTHALELVEIAAARRRIEQGRLEPREPLAKPLDVLAQHLVTVAAGGGFEAEAMYREVTGARAYAGLDRAEWQWTLDFISRGGQALAAYPQFRRVQDNGGGHYAIARSSIARRHRMAIGTITADSMMTVRYVRGGRIGSVEESFIARLKPGDNFLFAGRLLELARVRDMTAWVRTAGGRARNVPRWQGGRLPLSGELGTAMGELFDDWSAGRALPAEFETLEPILAIQARWSQLPGSGRLLAETVGSREGVHLFVYPFAGRGVHEGLAALLAWRLSRRSPVTIRTAVNDYGLELVGRGIAVPADGADLRALLSAEALADDLIACLNAGEMARRQFREIARIAGLVFEGYPGRGKSAHQVQASSGLVYDVLARFDADNRLLHQARDEVFTRQIESARLHAVLATIARQSIALTRPPRFTPLAFPLWAERMQNRVSSESASDRIDRMLDQLETSADKQ